MNERIIKKSLKISIIAIFILLSIFAWSNVAWATTGSFEDESGDLPNE